jgi:acyl dehydratase
MSSPTRIPSLAALSDWLGKELPPSPWIPVTQAHIQQFAEATGDHQWIHLDEERATRESPFGGTIAHGFLTLSLLSSLQQQTLVVEGTRMGVNYGLNKVRFMAPLRAGRSVRGRFTLAELSEIEGGRQMVWRVTIEQENSDKPVCVAEWVVRRYE